MITIFGLLIHTDLIDRTKPQNNDNFNLASPSVEVIDECIDVPSAVKSIYKNLPELVFSDISMPGYSGL